MDSSNSLSVILPLYNEEANIEDLVDKLIAYIKGHNIDFEIILVDDGNTDKSKSIIDSLAHQHPRVKTMSHDKNKGYGSAIRSGIYKAQKAGR